ncbi:MAG: GatB/YqeY domain-containing protein [Saprospiraceae bacterium]|nr:GatB/YqeY domain-containing protein [Saprospiraceae bacterium]
MRLESRIMGDLKAAMKAKDQAALRTIRAIKAQILLQKTDGSGAELTEEMEIKMIQKQMKQRQDSYDIYVKQGREDLAQTEKEELDVLKNYLPEQLSEDKIKEVVENIIASIGAQGMKDMGKVMGMASKELAGQADGKTISGIVRGLLNS